jgi:DNA-directed RNA polymerase subunit RPC12/RpoP
MEIVVYKCPRCRGIVEEEILLTFPPKIRYRCPSCGWDKIEETKIIYRVVEA